MPGPQFRRNFILPQLKRSVTPALVITPLGVATGDTVNDNSMTITLTAAVAAHETIIVAGAETASAALAGITDTGGNSYTTPPGLSELVTGTTRCRIIVCLDPATPLSIGNTISMAIAGNSNTKAIMAWKLNRVGVVRAHGRATGSTSPARVQLYHPASAGAACFGVLASNAATTPTNPTGMWTSSGVGQVSSKGYAFAYGLGLTPGRMTYGNITVGTAAWAAQLLALE